MNGDIARDGKPVSIIDIRDTHTTAKYILVDCTTRQVDADIAMISRIVGMQFSIIITIRILKVGSYCCQSSTAIDRALHGTVLDVQCHVTANDTRCQGSARSLSTAKHIAVVT